MDVDSFHGNISELCPDLNWNLDIDWSNVDYSSWDENLTFGENVSCPWRNKVSVSNDDGDLYEVTTGVVVALSLFYGTISLVAILGNALVMWIVATSRKMHSVTNYFIANLALADIIIGLFCIPFQFQAALLQRWNLPHFMCAFCPFFQTVSVNVSVFTLTAIAVDRYRAIVFPLNARPSKFRSKLVIVVIWLFSIMIAVPNAIGLRVVVDHGVDKCLPTNIQQELMLIYSYILVGLQYFLPLGVISFAYLRMGWELWGSRQPGNADHTRDAHVLKNKKKVIKMLFMVVAIFTFCWAPLQTYHVLQEISAINEYRYINIVWFFCYSLAMTNSCCNPFIYAIYNEKFKREFRQKFRWVLTPAEAHLSEYERSRNGQSFRRAFHSSALSKITITTKISNSSSCRSSPNGNSYRSSNSTINRGAGFHGAPNSFRVPVGGYGGRGNTQFSSQKHSGGHISSITGPNKLCSNSVDSGVASTNSKMRNSSFDSGILDYTRRPTIRSRLLSSTGDVDIDSSMSPREICHSRLHSEDEREKVSLGKASPVSGCGSSSMNDDVEEVHVFVPVTTLPIDEDDVCEGHKTETSL